KKISMTPTPDSASGATARQSVEEPKPQGAAGPFVLNLCSSTTPMALSNPEQPELKRFSFFVSRRFEEGRERFRLHMGYFQTLQEAEEWLGAVRDIYPGAWAGEAPGKKLRERAAAAAAAQAQHAAGPPPRVAPAAQKAPPAAPRHVPTLAVALPAPAQVAALNVPTVHAASPTGKPPAPVQVPRNVPVAKPAPASAQSAAAGAPAAIAKAPSALGTISAAKGAAAPWTVPVGSGGPRASAPLQSGSATPLAGFATGAGARPGSAG